MLCLLTADSRIMTPGADVFGRPAVAAPAQCRRRALRKFKIPSSAAFKKIGDAYKKTRGANVPRIGMINALSRS